MIVRDTPAGVEIAIRAQPRASTTEIAGPYGDRAIRIRVQAPPVDGRANQELVAFFATLFDTPKSRVEVLRGAAGRDKVVRVQGVSASLASARLQLSS